MNLLKVKKTIFNFLMLVWTFPIVWYVRTGGKKNTVVGSILKKISANSNEYHQLTLFPRFQEPLLELNFEALQSNVAIVIQGPVIHDDDFTINSVSIYQKIFPGAKIIISTWENQDLTFLSNFANVEIVCSKIPKNVGTLNVNLQILSSLAGVTRARDLGYMYVLKVRSDQRICHPLALSQLKNYIELFPVASDGNISSRIVMLGDVLNSYNSLAFHVSDFLVFGNTVDLCKYFEIPLDPRPYAFQEDVLKVFQEQYEFVKKNEGLLYVENKDKIAYGRFIRRLMAPEQYILINFIEKYVYGYKIKPDDYLFEYNNILKKYIIIVNKDDLGFYWYKSWHKYYQPNFYNRSGAGHLNFQIWLNLYLNQ